MKKSKFVLVIALAVVLAVTLVSANTFSWFTHSESKTTKTGNSLEWSSRNAYTANSSDGAIAVKTYKDVNNDGTYSQQVADTELNGTLQSGQIVRYRTEITNTSTDSSQSVSLYAPSVSIPKGGSSLFLGVNTPSRTHRNLYANVEAVAPKVEQKINKQNVYLGIKADQYDGVDKLKDKVYKIHAWNDSGTTSDALWGSSDIKDTGKTQKWKFDDFVFKDSSNNILDPDYKMFACTIDYRCTDMQFWNTSSNSYNDPKPKISENNTFMYFAHSNQYPAKAINLTPSAGIKSFYSTANVTVGQTIDLAGEGHEGTVTYSSSNSNIASVDRLTGVVTGVKAGTAKITMASIGKYGDKITAICTLTVSAAADTVLIDVPIVTNYNIPAQQADSRSNVVSVYWYVQNSSGGTQKYKINGLTVTK